MHAEIKNHAKYVLKQYNALLKQRLANKSKKPTVEAEKRLADLTAYHNQRVIDFQWERSIHLRVTLFFVVLTLIIVIGSAVLLGLMHPTWSWQEGITAPLLFVLCLTLLDLILVVLTMAYIRHYYRLENGVQNLYELTAKLYELNLR